MRLFAFDETEDVPYGIKVYAYYFWRILKTFAKSYFNEMHQTMPQVVVFFLGHKIFHLISLFR